MAAFPSEELQHLWVLARYWGLIPTIVLSCLALHVPAAAGIQMRAIGVVGKELGSSISRKICKCCSLTAVTQIGKGMAWKRWWGGTTITSIGRRLRKAKGS